MRSAGKVVNFSHKGSIILKTDRAPRIGDLIVDRRSGPIGKVIRITGPVSGPYVIVDPVRMEGGSMNSLLGRELFISEERNRRDSRPRGERRRPSETGGDRKRTGNHERKGPRSKSKFHGTGHGGKSSKNRGKGQRK